ncbi:hypothetical protein TSO221_20600 [Azospirillum sp. TSO22-1]|nr:hypothetical protein TSO221_20600 [Azospirillum sp. TSO22-1]
MLPGVRWLLLLFVLGIAAAGALASRAATDVHGKLAAAQAATALRAQIGRVGALVAASGDPRPLRRPDVAARHLDTLDQLDAAATALGAATASDDRQRAEALAARVAEFIHLRREAARVAAERGLDDVRLLPGSEAMRLNRLSLTHELDALALAADERIVRSAAALAEARQHWLSLLVGLLAGVVLLAFLQVVRLARRPVRLADPFTLQAG